MAGNASALYLAPGVNLPGIACLPAIGMYVLVEGFYRWPFAASFNHAVLDCCATLCCALQEGIVQRYMISCAHHASL